MADPKTDVRRLPTGERITLRECPWRGDEMQWEAEAMVNDLRGAADMHAIGATPDEAVQHLADYVASLRHEVDYDV